MAAKKDIIIRPLISEKVEKLTQKNNQYVFVVNKKANKIEIRNAVEEAYSVTVDKVNTAIMPAKSKSRFTRNGATKGRKPAFKKAYITLEPGEEIDFFGEL